MTATSPPPAALLGVELPGWAEPLVVRARTAGEDVGAALGIARDIGGALPQPGDGSTATRWTVLAELARANLTVARVVEAHADALAILAESGTTPDTALTWGVFAAEAPPARLEAVPTKDGRFALSGIKPWCSLGDCLDAALVTAHVTDGRQLFRVGLRQRTVRAEPAQRWVARGLRTVTSVPIDFDRTAADAVGAPGWYLRRAGFAWGGIGVAACWHGGAVGLADTLARAGSARQGEINALHVGIVDAALHASRAALRQAAADVDAGCAQPALLAQRTRAVVADSVERVLHQVGHALGPGPLAFDTDHVARVADLTLYVRQHHGERDLAALGDQVLGR